MNIIQKQPRSFAFKYLYHLNA